MAQRCRFKRWGDSFETKAGYGLFDLILSEDQTTVKNRQGLYLNAEKKTNWSENVWTYYAVDINEIIKAETAQQNFVQTLGKTFAEMPIGLAAFD